MGKFVRAAAVVAALGFASATTAHAQGLPAGVTQEQFDKGKAVYSGTGLCYACHGPKAEGVVGPKLVNRDAVGWWHSDGSIAGIAKFVAAGVAKEQAKSGIMMPAKGGNAKLTDEDVQAVSAYIYAISRK
jgi:cytochrome c5